MSEPLILPRFCANCAHFDGEGWCALPRHESPLPGYIGAPSIVVCTKHEPASADDVEGAAV